MELIAFIIIEKYNIDNILGNKAQYNQLITNLLCNLNHFLSFIIAM